MSSAREGEAKSGRLSALIVDDNPIVRAVLKRILPSYSVDCDEARDGREAVEKFERHLQEQRPYDMVCLDLGLPGMDGHAVLLRMRSAESRFQALAPAYVIVLSGEDDGQAVDQVFSEGASAYILKPFDRESFRTHVERLFRQKPGRAGAAPL